MVRNGSISIAVDSNGDTVEFSFCEFGNMAAVRRFLREALRAKWSALLSIVARPAAGQ